MTVEFIVSDRFRGGANNRTGLKPLGLHPEITSRGQRPPAGGGRRLAEGGGDGAAGADGVRSGTV